MNFKYFNLFFIAFKSLGGFLTRFFETSMEVWMAIVNLFLKNVQLEFNKDSIRIEEYSYSCFGIKSKEVQRFKRA